MSYTSTLQRPLGQLFVYLGLAFLLLFGALIPIFVWPVTLFPTFDTVMSETIFMKRFVLIGLAGATLMAAAGYLLVQRNVPLTPEAALPAALLLGWLLWGTASIYVNMVTGGISNSWPFWNHWLMIFLPGMAALFGLFVFDRPWAARLAVFAQLGAALIVTVIGVASWLGWRGFHQFVWGRDPREILGDPALAEFMPIIQGGGRSSFAMSTLANPEYAGTYISVMICMMLIVAFDWGARQRWSWFVRLPLFGIMALFFAYLVFTTSRMGLIAVALLVLFRLALLAEIRTRWIALVFALFVWAIVVLGVLWGGVVLAAASIAILVQLVHVYGVRGLLGTGDGLGRFVAIGGPILAVVLMVAYSMPGPWNPTGLRLAQRFTSLVTKSDNSLDERALMFMIASDMAWQNPIFGVGPGRYQTRYFETVTVISERDTSGMMELYRLRQGNLFGAQAHSDLLQTAAETGLVGIALFVLAILAMADRLLRIARRTDSAFALPALAILFGLLAFTAIMMSSFPLQMPSRAAAFWGIVAAALGIINGAAKETLPRP